MVEKCCEACGSHYYVEEHHIVFRSKAGYMVNIPLNIKHLCHICHRGNNGPHLCKETDTKYKIELQDKLYELFTKEYYSVEEIRDKLVTTDSQVKKILKTLIKNKEGYGRMQIVVRLMGGRLYIK